MHFALTALLLTIAHPLFSQNKFILTGGPCCGKSTVIRELEKRGYQVCHEAYGILYEESAATGTLDTFLPHTIEQRWRLFNKHIQQESALDPSRPAFLDRSTPDVIFYGKHVKIDLPEDLLTAYAHHKNDYDIVFFFEPLPQELYYSTAVRYESWQEAQAIHAVLLEGYTKDNFRIVHVPFDTVENRIDFVVQYVASYQQ